MQILARRRRPGTHGFIDDGDRGAGALEHPAAIRQPNGIVVRVEDVRRGQTIHVIAGGHGQQAVPDRRAQVAFQFDGIARGAPDGAVVDHREDDVGDGHVPGPHDHTLVGIVNHAVFQAQLAAGGQVEGGIGKSHRHPLGGGAVATVEFHGVADGVGDRDVPQFKTHAVVRLDADRIEGPVQHGTVHQRIGVALEDDRRQVEAAGGIRLRNAPRFQAPVHTGIDVDHIAPVRAAFQVVFRQQGVQVRHRLRTGQAAVGIVSHGRAIHIIRNGIVVDIEMEGLVAHGERPGDVNTAGRAFDLQIGLHRLFAPGRIPGPGFRPGGQPRHQVGPTGPAIRGIGDGHRAGRHRAAGEPGQQHVGARRPAPVAETDPRQPAVRGSLGCFAGVAVPAQVHPPAIGGGFRTRQGRITSIDHHRIFRRRIQDKRRSGWIIAPARTLQVVIVHVQIGEPGLTGKTVPVQPGCRRPIADGIIFALEPGRLLFQGGQGAVRAVEVVIVGIQLSAHRINGLAQAKRAQNAVADRHTGRRID